MGDVYYLHEGRTKTGKPRYFFSRTRRTEAIAEVPPGFEVAENIDGVVSLRRHRTPKNPIPAADLRAIEAELGRRPHLRYHQVRAEDGELVIYAPLNSPETLSDGILGALAFPGARERAIARYMACAQYSPVMKFVREGDSYAAHRMTYRGHGGWSWPLGSGTIAAMAKRFVPPIGTDRFFELM